MTPAIAAIHDVPYSKFPAKLGEIEGRFDAV
jgi:hypothetical protein